MRNGTTFSNSGSSLNGVGRFIEAGSHLPRQFVVGIILVLALFAFEMFNFDTTRYALQSLLGEVRFMGLAWATILAIAFCAIDFAGLARLFTPERGRDEPKEVWYLMGAWLLGATMNALMTWWAVSLTLLNHDLGNEVLSREQLLKIVPVFVAVLVWLTRILFIGAVTIAGERLLNFHTSRSETVRPVPAKSQGQPAAPRPAAVPQRTTGSQGRPQPKPQTVDLATPPANDYNNGRVRQRPPRPAATARASTTNGQSRGDRT